MAFKASSLLALVLICSTLLATAWQALAARNIVAKNSNTNDKKEPQFLFKSDGVYIPGIGRVGLPPVPGFTPQNPFPGGSGGAGSGQAGRSYVPGGDFPFVPNPVLRFQILAVLVEFQLQFIREPRSLMSHHA